MNRFDEKYTIRLANYEEVDEVMDFIDTYWKKNHILATDRKFFEYEMVIEGKVNFLIAKTHESNRIEGLLGFLPCSKRSEKLDVWGVVWKTIEGAVPMLGMELKKRLMTIIGARTDLGVGANAETSVPLLSRIYKYYTAKMKHFYMLSNTECFNIAKVVSKPIQQHRTDIKTHVKKLDNIELLEVFFDFNSVSEQIPFKDAWYYNRRFYNHPVYNYDVWGLSDEKQNRAICVTKSQLYKGISVVRIVDYLGCQHLFSGCGEFLNHLLKDNEYIDFYFDGFNSQYALDAGMIERTDDDLNIIPDYFSPFEQKNIDIWVDSSNRVDRCCFFKADGDQDRPNSILE